MPAAQSFIDPTALMRIRSLELRAKIVVEGLWKGMHRSPWHGFSVEFSEYRPYTRGDDPRHIDWKLAARSERYFIKKFEDETNLRCQLVLDHSKSMQFASAGYSKATYAATMAATLALFLMKQGDAVGLTTFADRIAAHLPARNRPGHLRHLMVELEKPHPPGHSSFGLTIRQLAEQLPRKGLICLFSDMLAPIEKLEAQLASLGALGHQVLLFHLMDRAEIDFTFDEPALFRDSETGQETFINPTEAREIYLSRLQQHRQAVKTAAEKAGVTYLWTPTDQALEQTLFEFLNQKN